MYSVKLREMAEEIENVHIPEEFRFGEFENGFDMMELYEELFDYSYEIKNNRPLKSNFSIFSNNKDTVFEQLKISKTKNKQIQDICDICYRFCCEIYLFIS